MQLSEKCCKLKFCITSNGSFCANNNAETMFYKAHRDVLSVRRAGLIAENKTTSSDYKSELRN